ncbi:MAG: DegT/DnrJ/EryC1/StrS family aminotransferase [Vicinamibacterales bacterium]
MSAVRTTYLPFHRPSIGDEEVQAVAETLRSGWLTSGPKVQEFENAFAEAIGARHAVALSSATAALHLSLEAIGIGPGDEVLVPAMTFTATAEVVVHLGAKPVLVDCRPETLNIDPASVEAAITSRSRAIVPVHMGGLACDMDHLGDIAARHGLVIVEDAAHALPTTWRGALVGAISPLTCFSFYATKTITTGEGGMVTTDDDARAARIRLMSLHGISRDGWARYTAAGSWQYEVHEAGFKNNMSDLAAALGIEQLRKLRVFRDRRAWIAQQYDTAFAAMPEIGLPPRDGRSEHAWHLYVIQLALERLRVDRAQFIAELKARNIGASVHFIPLHRHPYYQRTLGVGPDDFPAATAAFHRIVSLPIFPAMSDADAADVIAAVSDIVRCHRR